MAKNVANSIFKTVYVRGADGWYDNTSPYNDGETAKADDNNLGSLSSPFAMIQKAVDTIIARNCGEPVESNNGTSDDKTFTIYIDGTLTQDEAPSGEGMVDFFKLTKNLKLMIKTLFGTATLDANQNSRVIYVVPASGTLNLTLEKLVITNGKVDENGGGVCNSSGATSTITNCSFTSCAAGLQGGGIRNAGILTVSNVTYSGCTSGNGDTDLYNVGTLNP